MDIDVRNARSATGSLSGLPGLLATLSTYPEPDTALNAVFTGPLRKFQPRGSALWIPKRDVAELIASAGHTPWELEMWQSIPLAGEGPVARCIRDAQLFKFSLGTARDTFPDIEAWDLERDEVDRQLFGEAARDRATGVDAVLAPIVVRGIVVGAMGFMTYGNVEWTIDDVSLVSACTAALGLWLSNRSRLSNTNPAATIGPLSDRQREILSLVHHGRSISFIAGRIGVSVSTVKLEIQRACVALDAEHRVDAASIAVARGLIHA